MPCNPSRRRRPAAFVKLLGKFGQDFARDERGTIAVVFAVMFIAVFTIVAVAVDFSISSSAKVRQQRALDAATLAASDRLGTPNQDVTGPAVAQAYFNANTKGQTGGALTGVTLDANTGRVTATAGTSVLSTLLRGIGINYTDVKGRSVVAKGHSSVEVALVLDNSGSMSSEIDNLKTAAKNMSGILFTGLEGTERMRIALVPFAASVNVGRQYATASWIDSTGVSPVHYENLDQARTRFQLFADMGQTWGGCVEARPAPYDTNDTAPSSGNPATLFVPMFAPDEPDDVNSGGNSYPNNYLVDDGGACTPQDTVCTKYRNYDGKCTRWAKVPISPALAQSRICKYAGQNVSSGAGPNANCTTAAILPLTSTKSQVLSAIDTMVANGYTNILEGTMWGWRVLSPGAPFTEGRSSSDSNNRKYLVIMTDGENTYQPYSNHNGSMYGAFAYASKGRLGTSSLTSEMDNKTIAACANAKASGIIIYTIAFRGAVTSAAARAVLNACASDSSRALTATDSTALGKAFEEIGRQISQLRVAG
ncbi:MAG: TadE/TadG family protein [Hyphomicrobiaceae bacterium]|nr:TadE/TadG family protein [Hyphomicrobiaceae bacterium]